MSIKENAVVPPRLNFRWRVVDIVVASVLGVAVALIFVAFNLGWSGIKAPFEAVLPGFQGLLEPVWYIGGVLGALVIRKPGAAIYVETVAALVSALVGNQWGGFSTIEAGLVQGLGAEIIFLLFAYRVWNLPVTLLAGATAGIFGAVNSIIFWSPGASWGFITVYVGAQIIGGALIAGLLVWFAVKGLAATGALNRFAVGRSLGVRV
ncbi:energy-coupling factor transport system substrate-specific component [Mycetocola sp. BIGb0189]|uniref:ECF transporter S component n=1 Tax=Mycetocola sp. BIGb0189 TaxID=2940604 RepID=UPI0021673CD6|nr:ECF transporter S component [Mycetocola sp. BIGb0189]MCS4275820.1 energy-coupling factor transport system substrate-specific component [Mycetocola sp. BIGb0189]